MGSDRNQDMHNGSCKNLCIMIAILENSKGTGKRQHALADSGCSEALTKLPLSPGLQSCCARWPVLKCISVSICHCRSGHFFQLCSSAVWSHSVSWLNLTNALSPQTITAQLVWQRSDTSSGPVLSHAALSQMLEYVWRWSHTCKQLFCSQPCGGCYHILWVLYKIKGYNKVGLHEINFVNWCAVSLVLLVWVTLLKSFI